MRRLAISSTSVYTAIPTTTRCPGIFLRDCLRSQVERLGLPPATETSSGGLIAAVRFLLKPILDSFCPLFRLTFQSNMAQADVDPIPRQIIWWINDFPYWLETGVEHHVCPQHKQNPHYNLILLHNSIEMAAFSMENTVLKAATSTEIRSNDGLLACVPR